MAIENGTIITIRTRTDGQQHGAAGGPGNACAGRMPIQARVISEDEHRPRERICGARVVGTVARDLQFGQCMGVSLGSLAESTVSSSISRQQL